MHSQQLSRHKSAAQVLQIVFASEPEDLEEAYALGELYAVHTLRPNEKQPSQ